MKIARCDVYSYRLPLTMPLPVAGRLLERRDGLALHLVAESGREGWGDIAPLPGFSRESLAEAQQQALALARRTVGRARGLDDPRLLDLCPSVRFGFDSAWMMLGADAQNTSTFRQSALLYGDTEHCLELVRSAVQKAFRTFKLKVGRGRVEEDAERIRRIQAALPGETELRLDANRAWTLEQARALAHQLPEFKPAYIEEPLADPAQLSAFHEETGWNLALDETLRGYRPEDELPAIKGVVAWVIKPTLVGPLYDTLAWQARAQGEGLSAVISSSFESGLGIRMLGEIASRDPDVAAGLDTYRYLAEDVLSARLDFDEAFIDLHEARNIQVNPARLNLLT